MKPLFVGAMTLALLSVNSHAQTTQPECGTMDSSVNNEGIYSITYRTNSVFPETPKRVTVEYVPGKAISSLTACGYSITFDGNELKVKASNAADLLKLMGYTYRSTYTGFVLFPVKYSYKKNPSIDIDTVNKKIWDSLWSNEFSQVDGDDLTVMAVRLDNGSLQKLFYKAVLTPVDYADATQLINIYINHTDPKTLNVARAQLDLSKSTYTVWYRYPFPTK